MAEAAQAAPTGKRAYHRRVADPRSAADAAATGGTGPQGPVEPAAPVRESMERIDAPLTRVSRFDLDNEMFAIPAEYKKPGWDYEYKAVSVLNEPVSGSEQALWHRQGWRREKAKDWPTLVPPDWTHDYVEQGGQILFGRPAHLTQEARQEDYSAAKKQEEDRIRAAATGKQSGGAGEVRGVVVKPLGVELMGEAGTYRK